MLQITDQAMSEQSNILDTIKTKLVQASTATTSSDGVKALDQDVKKLLKQLDNIARDTNYNGIALLQADNTASGTGMATTKVFQLGEYASSTIELSSSVQANTVGLDVATSDMSFTTNTAARNLLTKVDKALTSLNKMRSRVGSIQNQVESSVRNLEVRNVNIKSAESLIRDVDYAKESANFNKMNIIAQAGTYALSQANAASQNVMRLLQ
jgi:flagellin